MRSYCIAWGAILNNLVKTYSGKGYENECMFMYNWVTSLYIRNHHKVVNQLPLTCCLEFRRWPGRLYSSLSFCFKWGNWNSCFSTLFDFISSILPIERHFSNSLKVCEQESPRRFAVFAPDLCSLISLELFPGSLVLINNKWCGADR